MWVAMRLQLRASVDFLVCRLDGSLYVTEGVVVAALLNEGAYLKEEAVPVLLRPCKHYLDVLCTLNFEGVQSIPSCPWVPVKGQI